MLSLRYMSERAEQNLRRTAEVSLLLAAAASLILWLVRIYNVVSAATPYLLATTGYEWEDLFSIWKFTQHQAVYADPHRIPFAVSSYNWAFYYFYGSVANAWLHLLHLDAVSIATIGRLISLIFTLITGGIFWLIWRDFRKAGLFANPRVAWAWILIATLSPLAGYWSFTVRPDAGALAFEAAGLYAILRCLRKQDDRLIFLAALLFYAAWAFKQSSVTLLAGSALALILLKRWRAFLTLSSIWWLLVMVTLFAGGPVYRENVLFSQLHLPMQVSLGLTNALRAECKNPFLWLCIVAVLSLSWRNFRTLASRPAEAAVTVVVLFSLCFALVTSCKVGANDNYYIPAAWSAMLAFALAAERMHSRWVAEGLAVCSWLMTGAIALSPTGYTFYYDFRSQDFTYNVATIVTEKLRHLPAPAFAIEPYANMPWVQPAAPHFVVADTYYYDRKAGVPVEDGGWENLAAEGYFGTLVFDQNYNPPPRMLRKYELVDEYKDEFVDLKFYRRIGANTS